MKHLYIKPEANILCFQSAERLAVNPSDFIDDGTDDFDTVVDLDDLLGRN